MSFFLFKSGNNTQGEWRALEGRSKQNQKNKNLQGPKIKMGRVAGKNGLDKYFPLKGSLICLAGMNHDFLPKGNRNQFA